MVTKKIKITNPAGLNLEPAGMLCERSVKYKCRISFVTGSYEANAKSVLSVLGACVKSGDEIDFTCDGEDEEIAMKELSELFEKGLRR